MGLVEIGEILLATDTPPFLTSGTKCAVETTPDGYYTLHASEVTLYTCKLRQRGRRIWTGSIVEALGYAISKLGFEAKGDVVECTDTNCTIRFAVSVPTTYIQEAQTTRCHRYMPRLFANLTPPNAIVAKEAVHVDPKKQLHSAKIPDLFPLLKTADEILSEMIYDSDTPKSWLEQLPTVVLCKIFDLCDPASFRALQSCSRLLHSTARDAIPSIKTELCAHQRKSLKWMAWREQPGRQLPHFAKQYIHTEWGTLEADELAGTLLSRDEKPYEDIRGGILADEPGLGKTATILSLVMRTRGLLPTPPEGSVVTIRTTTDGREVGWYKKTREPERRCSSVSLRSRVYDPHTGRVLAQSVSYSQLHSPTYAQVKGEMPYPKRQRSHSCVKEEEQVMLNADTVTNGSMPSTSGDVNMDYTLEKWIMCDRCKKWRLIPDWYKAAGFFWSCAMHPCSEIIDCDTESKDEDSMEIDYVTSDSGFVPAGKVSVTEANFCHFLRLMTHFRTTGPEPLFTLCRLAAAELHHGFTVPEAYTCSNDCRELYERIGLERVASRKRQSMLDKPEARWKIPESHRYLDLDTVSLEEVLMRRTGQENDRTFLSPATLIVVPFPLIEQWKHEISKHFHGQHLRVHVVTKTVDYPMRLCQLAWSYDVVLTSFTHLSSAVSEQLLQIHWLRVVLDEGHLIGATLSRTSRKVRISQLNTDRRWIITGTPTPDLVHRSTVSHLYPLIQFLKIEPFDHCRSLWEETIQKPFEAGLPEGKRRLLTLLNTLMIRTFKDEIRGLVHVHRDVTSLAFDPAHAASYNELVEVVQRNLLLADFGEEGHEESLLNPANTKWSSEMLRNVHMSCCVAGTCLLSVNERQLADTLTKLALRHGHSTELMKGAPWLVPVYHPLREIEDGLRHGGPCGCCHEISRLPVVTPCAHLLCPSCLKGDREKCAVCGVPYVMQSASEMARGLHNSDPKLPVPIEVIEWQPSYTQAGAVGKSGGGWHPNWRATQSSKCKQLLNRLRDLGMAQAHESGPKAIIFSRFWPHINLINSCLIDAGIAHCVLKKDLKQREKNSVVDRFRTDPTINVLLMDTTGAVGLDLSMASWVFLMEPLLDRSLEEQIISRAHRMGAESDIHVEIMIMKGSVEEHSMQRFISAVDDVPTDISEDNRAIRNTLITGLKRVIDADIVAG